MVVRVLAFLLGIYCGIAYAGRDPTLPQGGLYVESGEVAEGPVALSAKMVLISAERKLALIDDRILTVGDEFNNGKILNISEDGVEILHENGEIEFLPVQSTDTAASWKFLKVYRDE